jgi:spore germination cell wall hydrolase CwlJ-like protein
MVTIKKKPNNPDGRQPGLDNIPVVDILARVIWGEAEGEGFEGMQAVGNVILNRANIKKNKTIPEVMFRKDQFSAIGDKDRFNAMINLTPDNPQYIQALEISRKLLSGKLKDITNGATHFYNPNTANMELDWIKQYPVVTTIGKHTFAKGNF